MSGRKVVETGSLNVTNVIGQVVFLGFFLALFGPSIRVIRGVSPFPWSAEALAKPATVQQFNDLTQRSQLSA